VENMYTYMSMCTHHLSLALTILIHKCVRKKQVTYQAPKSHTPKTVIYQQHVWKPNLKMFKLVFEFSSILHSRLRKYKILCGASIHCAFTCYFISKIINLETPVQKLIQTLCTGSSFVTSSSNMRLIFRTKVDQSIFTS
jgi:hypothetical protein